MWRAIGACEQSCDDNEAANERMQNAVSADLVRMQLQISELRLSDRLAFVLVLMFGIGVGVFAATNAWKAEAEAAKWTPTTYICPGPLGIDPKPHGWKGGV